MPKKKINTTGKENPEIRRAGVLLEQIDSKVDVALEGLVALDKKVERHCGGFQEFRQEIFFRFDGYLMNCTSFAMSLRRR